MDSDDDNDGYTNLEEYEAGTDPNDDASYPQPFCTSCISQNDDRGAGPSVYVREKEPPIRLYRMANDVRKEGDWYATRIVRPARLG